MTAAIIFLVGFVVGFQSEDSDTLTLDYCYERIENHYPLAKKVELRERIAKLNKKIIGTAAYPQLNFGATATYQSEVPELSVSSSGQFSGPELSNDQYKITMDVSQSIYDGGSTGIQQDIREGEGAQKKLQTKVQLHQVKEQVNETFFGILLAQEQLKIVQSLTKSLRSQLRDVRSKVTNGVLLPSQQYILEAELIKTKQDSSAIQSNIRSGYQVLSELIGQKVGSEVRLKTPKINNSLSDSLTELRPEFKLFDQNRRLLDHQQQFAQTNKFPTFSAFGTMGYGRPGFDVFENELHPYYILGLKLQWNFWKSRNASRQQKIYQIEKKNITEEERAFERQLRATLSRLREDMVSLEEQINLDQKIIELREKVVDEKASQMKNGTATATEYVTELSKAIQARLSMRMHTIKLDQVQVEYRTELGRSEY